MSKAKNTTTLAELAGTNRGLSKLTVAEIKALIKGTEVAKAEVEPTKAQKFYTEVIVGKAEERANHKKANIAAAAWMREHGLVPSGTAWTAVKEGERSIKALKAMNESDGLTAKPKSKETSVGAQPKARSKKATKETPVNVTEQHATVTEKDIEAEVKALIKGGFTEDEARTILG
jgi:hypothetical protein